MHNTYSVRAARAGLAVIINTAEAGDPVVITRGGEPVAAIVSMDAYATLEQAEDELLARDAAKILNAEGDGPHHTLIDILTDIFKQPSE